MVNLLFTNGVKVILCTEKQFCRICDSRRHIRRVTVPKSLSAALSAIDLIPRLGQIAINKACDGGWSNFHFVSLAKNGKRERNHSPSDRAVSFDGRFRRGCSLASGVIGTAVHNGSVYFLLSSPFTLRRAVPACLDAHIGPVGATARVGSRQS